MRTVEEQGRVVPLDSLAGRRGLPLPQDALLVLIQPRPLTPDENVALDTWVRAGGHVLLFADPMLTVHSAFALGDPRRPQDVAMLSPILDHWGLSLEFDDTQRNEERYQQVRGTSIPVNLRGQLRVSPAGACRTEATKLLADCRIGKGRAVVIADAALFDGEDAGRVGAFRALISLAAS
ncbi:hypothetical protein HNO88_001780 [Novosphingobium chloroacetimidivorans]|uniref:DUF4350 domain-containing protein n=1 Tax=Novosphingobium chloroacetimidivorans TaxID=1428314 RepID=A0A7W7NWU3_9SPHN|nr:DUF4350 domain-containing protein [Novosphingobium chloroacetimidivorans]MBB4858457.1 hypothetical protein [Novosphingobium chloroacetimidivorans]